MKNVLYGKKCQVLTVVAHLFSIPFTISPFPQRGAAMWFVWG